MPSKPDHRRGPTTERLVLRKFEASDAQALYELCSDPEVMRYTGEPLMTSVDEARVGIETHPDWVDPGYGRWGVVLRELGEDSPPSGFCGLKYLPEIDEVDIGYRLRTQYWGRGLATEAARASIEYGFSVLELPRIIGLVLPGNPASIRVLEKLGLERDGDVEYFGEHAQRWVIHRTSA